MQFTAHIHWKINDEMLKQQKRRVCMAHRQRILFSLSFFLFLTPPLTSRKILYTKILIDWMFLMLIINSEYFMLFFLFSSRLKMILLICCVHFWQIFTLISNLKNNLTEREREYVSVRAKDEWNLILHYFKSVSGGKL